MNDFSSICEILFVLSFAFVVVFYTRAENTIEEGFHFFLRDTTLYIERVKDLPTIFLIRILLIQQFG